MLLGTEPVVLLAFKKTLKLGEAGENTRNTLLYKVYSLFHVAFWNDAALSFTGADVVGCWERLVPARYAWGTLFKGSLLLC